MMGEYSIEGLALSRTNVRLGVRHFFAREGGWLMFQAYGVYPRVDQPVLLSEPPQAAKPSRQGYHAAQTEPKVGHG